MLAASRSTPGAPAPRLILLALFFVLLAPEATASRDPETCETASPIPCLSSLIVPLDFFHHDVDLGACAPGASDGPDVFFSFELTEALNEILIEASPLDSFDVAIAVFDGSCQNCLGGANANGPGGGEQLELANLPAGTYNIAVKGPGGSGGPVSLSLDCAGQPAQVEPIPPERTERWGRIKQRYVQ